MDLLKTTSYEYGRAYQLKQADKFRNRRNNHWRYRIALAQKLVEHHARPRLQGRSNDDIVIVDIGCSIGTFAIEFAKMGYCSYGIDFDNSALEIARHLAQEENVSPEFICGDVSDWSQKLPTIDIAICFDVFEHLHDDELGSFLTGIKKQLSKQGSLVFHTFPTQYSHIFLNKRFYIRYPLLPFSLFPPSKFDVIVKGYSCLIDMGLLLTKGATYKESVKLSGHCNPTTAERLTDILKRAGYEIIFIESSNLYDLKGSVGIRFPRQPIAHGNIYGVVALKTS